MSSPCFKFKQFTVFHDRCAHRVGTDGVLLGAWADGGERILDIGTGTGLIALMMAQRFPNTRIDAIEPDIPSAEQAQENVGNSPFATQISIDKTRLQDFPPPEKYDCIVCNPPFYVDGLLGDDERRMNARHNQSLPFAELMDRVAELLTNEGQFSVVLPSSSVPAIVAEGLRNGLSLERRTDVATVEGKEPKRSLLKFVKGKASMMLETVFMKDAEGHRSEWYEALTSDFYL